MSRRSSRRIPHGGSRLRRSDALITVCGMAAKTERQAYRGVEMPFDPFSRPLQWDDARRGLLNGRAAMPLQRAPKRFVDSMSKRRVAWPDFKPRRNPSPTMVRSPTPSSPIPDKRIGTSKSPQSPCGGRTPSWLR